MGLARIATISLDINHRNLTLGQDGPTFFSRVRTDATGLNGMPQLNGQTGTPAKALTHLVLTRTPSGTEQLFVNGVHDATRTTAGTLSNWDETFHLAVANELDDARPWLGTYHTLAIYDRALSAAQVTQHHQAGPP